MADSLAAHSAPYKKFIFECLAARLNNAGLDKAAEISRRPAFDWDLCLQVADAELVSPLLHVIIDGRHLAPQFAETALRRKYEFINRRNLFLLHQLTTTTALLQSSGIDVIVLKGAALVETIYQDIALRPMRDLDLLLRRRQLPQAVALLTARGYQQKAAMLGDAYPVGLAKPGLEPLLLELHWTLFHSLYYHQELVIDWFWQTAQQVPSAGGPILVLSLEAQLLHLCGHLTLHHLHHTQLLWRHDLAALIFQKGDQIRWHLLLHKAQTFQLLLPLREVLPDLAREWGAPVPQDVLRQLALLPVSAGEREAFALSTALKQSEGQGYWFRLQEMQGWRRRLFYVLRWLFPAPAALRARYGVTRPSSTPLLYAAHWWTALRLALQALLPRRG